MSSRSFVRRSTANVPVGFLALPLVCAACSPSDAPLGSTPALSHDVDEEPQDADASHSSSFPVVPEPDPSQTLDAGQVAPAALPGEPFSFELTDSVYVDLSGPNVVSRTERSKSDWDLHFEELEIYTNGGAAGPGEGASFGPTSELELLFDTAPEVPMRADVSDGAMSNWYWFRQEGISSRLRIYGVRDGIGRFYKLQVLSYYAHTATEAESGMYTIRFAEVAETGNGETTEMAGIDGRAGGVTIPAGAVAGCVDLSTGTQHLLKKEEWLQRQDWHVCFQRTEVFVNGGLSGPGRVAVVDLEQDLGSTSPEPVSSEEASRTATNDLERFDKVGYNELSHPDLPWDREYQVQPRIGDNWLSENGRAPLPGSWLVRGADGLSHYALFFTALTVGADGRRQVEVQVKSLK